MAHFVQNWLFLVQNLPKSPMKQQKSPIIIPWQIWYLSKFLNFPISVFQNHRLLKTLKYAILGPKFSKIAHETVKIDKNRHLAGTDKNCTIWVKIKHFCGKLEFPRGFMLYACWLCLRLSPLTTIYQFPHITHKIAPYILFWTMYAFCKV